VKFLAIKHRQGVDSWGSYDKSTALHLALSKGHVEAAHILIEYDANLTAQKEDGLTPLHVLLKSNRPDADLAQFLIEHGADLTAQKKDGLTPLHVLSESISLDADLARFLVKHSADPTA